MNKSDYGVAKVRRGGNYVKGVLIKIETG